MITATQSAKPHLLTSIDSFIQAYNLHDNSFDYTANYNFVTGHISSLAAQFRKAELSGMTKEEIEAHIEPVREIIRQSPFMARTQDWPRGYQGDHETIEYLYNGENKAVYNSFGYFVEEFALRSPTAQQHRNKVLHQSDLILKTIINSKNANILSIGSGGCIDVLNILPFIHNNNYSLVFNDMDMGALNFSQERLISIKDKCSFINENIVRAREVFQKGPYDLVITGGVFDYLPDKTIIFLLKNFKNNLLKSGGKFFFTNIKKDNPIRVEIEYMGKWVLIERTYDDIIRLSSEAGYDINEINVQTDSTGFTYLVELTNSVSGVL